MDGDYFIFPQIKSARFPSIVSNQGIRRTWADIEPTLFCMSSWACTESGTQFARSDISYSRPNAKKKMQLAAAISILRPASPNDAPVVWQMNRFYWLSSIWNLHHKIFIFIPRAPPRIPPSLVERPTRVERQIS